MRKLLRHHIWKPVVSLLALMTVLVGTAGTASATITWPHIQMVNQESQQRLYAGAIGSGGTTVPLNSLAHYCHKFTTLTNNSGH
ncbi:hypothetical protein [Actinoallomurus sp. NPDC050550]|uniref:hypothetical protein n=1 Tax=Actinoallomurus sp. NPDC050550 TaxID=3154937 RepID=UPI0033FD7FCC